MRLKGTTWDLPRGYDCAAASEVCAAESGLRVEWNGRSPPNVADKRNVAPASFSDLMRLGDPLAGPLANGGTYPPEREAEGLESMAAGTVHGAILPLADAGAL